MSEQIRARPFGETLASVERSRWAWVGILGAALVAGWIVLATAVPLPRYEPSLAGRLEVDGYPIVLQSEHGGTVENLSLRLDRRVREGEVLLSLDTRALREKAEQLRVRRDGLETALAAKQRELAAAQRQLEQLENQQAARLAELSVKKKARKTAAQLARSRAERVDELGKAAIGTAEEAEKAQAEAELAKLGVEEIGKAGKTTQAEFGTRISELATVIAGLDASVVESRTALQTVQLDIAANQRVIDDHQIRAPATGRLARVTPLGAGSVVAPGAELAVLITERPPIVRAEFSARSAAGRLVAGQTARIRFDAFSWLEYGSVEAVVRAVGEQTVDGAIEVELELDNAEQARMPLRHGQTCTADIEVERTTMVRVLARSIGLLGRGGE